MNQSPSSENGMPAKDRPTVRVKASANIPNETVVHITMEVVDAKGKVSIRSAAISDNASATGLSSVSRKQTSMQPMKVYQWAETKNKEADLHRVLFWGSIIVYALMVGLFIERFPIYFFTDEAVHTNLAADFWNNGLKNNAGEFLPPYFSIDPSFSLNGVSVYVQLIPYLLFGKSVVVTRMASALITLLGAIMVGLLLKQVFKINSYWLGVILLITSPSWFLHARTAFEYMEVASFFAAMLYFYNRYRQGENKYLYATVVAGALTFYTHGLGQVLAGITALLLFVSDFRYHFEPERRWTVLRALGLAVVLFLPYLNYNLAHSDAVSGEVQARKSYWTDINNTSIEKIGQFLAQYTRGLSPLFWFVPVAWAQAIKDRIMSGAPSLAFLAYLFNTDDIGRHTMLGYGDILLPLLPFAVWGIIRAVRNFRASEYRTILIALLVAPIPASIVAVGMPRLLWMVVPWIILIALGLDEAIHLLDHYTPAKAYLASLALFILLAGTGIYMLSDALINGPLWFQDYGLFGMQYGASQIFHDTVLPELEKDPNMHVVVSPTWANGTEQFLSFFIPSDSLPRVTMGQPMDFIEDLNTPWPEMSFISTAEEYNNLLQDPKYKNIVAQKAIPYPNGQPGFFLVTLAPADNLSETLAAEHALNRKPVEDTMMFNGQQIRVIHSPLDAAIGGLPDIFDNDPETLARVLEANPFMIDLYPLTPIDTHSVFIKTGSMPDFTVTIRLYAPGANEAIEYSQTYNNLPPDPEVTIVFDRGPEKAGRIEIEVRDNTSGETSQIHLRTIQFK